VDLKPQQGRYWLPHDRAKAPEQFDADVRTVCTLYHQAQTLQAPGTHVVRTDEKTGIQALERAHPTRPMMPGFVERPEYAYSRHGTQTLIGNFVIAPGQLLPPSVGPTRTAEDFAAHLKRTIETAPAAGWIFIVDRLHSHQSETLVHLVATHGGIADELGVQGTLGVFQSMATRAAFLQDPQHRVRCVYTPKHPSWLNQMELWCSILVRRLLKRASFSSVAALHERILAFIDYFNRTMATPFKWTYAGRPLTA
jgi:DDE superfamily endonuclease